MHERSTLNPYTRAKASKKHPTSMMEKQPSHAKGHRPMMPRPKLASAQGTMVNLGNEHGSSVPADFQQQERLETRIQHRYGSLGSQGYGADGMLGEDEGEGEG